MATRLYPNNSGRLGASQTDPSAALATWTTSTLSGFVQFLAGCSIQRPTNVSHQCGTGTDPSSRPGILLISPQLQSQTISAGNVKGQFIIREANLTDDVQLAFALVIIKPDGTARSIWLDVSANAENATTEAPTAFTNRKLRDASGNVSISLPEITVEDGDRIGLEIGTKAYSTSTATAAVTVAPAAATTNVVDLPEDDTTTTTTSQPWIEFSQDIKFKYPFFYRSAAVPSDGGSNATATLTITPPTSMRAGDLVVVHCQSRSSATWSIGVTGGQTWNSLAAYDRAATDCFNRVFWCVFNGTWSASPRFDSTSSTCTTAVMNVFRGRSTDEIWVEDVSQTDTDHAAAATIQRVGLTYTGNARNTVALYAWATADDNTWTFSSFSGGQLDPLQTDWNQQRNTAGQDQSMTFVWADPVDANGNQGAYTTPDITMAEATLGNDACVSWIMAWRAIDFNILNMPTMRPPSKLKG